MPKISVVMPVYNNEKYLRSCLDGLLSQTVRNIEIICVNDGSTDSSQEILESYAAADPRFKILFQQNQGAGAARNYGMKAAQGDYIIFLDSDDIFEPVLLEKLLKKTEESESDVTVCRSDRYNQKNQKYVSCLWTVRKELLPERQPFSCNDIKRDFFMAFVWWPWDKLYRRSFINRLGIQYQNLRTTNDLFFVAGSMLKAEKISYINDVLVHHRVGMTSSLSVTREKSWDCFYKALLQLRAFMKKENIYSRFEQDFINYCLHFSLWHLETLSGSSFNLLYNALRDNWFEDLGLLDKEKNYYYNAKNYAMLKYIMETDITSYLRLKSGFQNQGNGDLPCYSSRVLNLYMRVKLYYKGYGLKETIKKIFLTITGMLFF